MGPNELKWVNNKKINKDKNYDQVGHGFDLWS